MSSAKQKHKENLRYPHVKRNWIKAIMKIRGGYKRTNTLQGGVHLVGHPETSDISHIRTVGIGTRINRGLWAGFREAPRLTA